MTDAIRRAPSGGTGGIPPANPENPSGPRLQAGTLRARLREQTRHAVGIGALKSISTDYEFVEDGGVRFLVRILSNLERKDGERRLREAQTRETGKAVNPFLPYEPDLYVGDVSPTHAAVLNKFNVVEEHLLVITRRFEEQESLLTLGDFEALCWCLEEYEGLGFYNGGMEAGASQRHKHLQIVPRALVPGGSPLPMEHLFRKAVQPWVIASLPGLPFVNAFCRLGEPFEERPGSHLPKLAARIHEVYRAMVKLVGVEEVDAGGWLRQSRPYCFLATRAWLFAVPRSREFFEGVSVNSLGYAGGLLVRNESQLDLVKRVGPMRILTEVGFPA